MPICADDVLWVRETFSFQGCETCQAAYQSCIPDCYKNEKGCFVYRTNYGSTTNKAEGTENKMVSAFKKIGAAVVTFFAVEKIIAFGKSCVEAAADVQASNAQFSATFGSLQSAATKAFGKVSESTGILATRLKTEGTKAFSMFKGAGMDANNALGQSEKFLNIAADAAAYYDISLEDASARVLGFAKGNFENGDAIGVFTNETQRNKVAMEQYGKSYSDCTEAQKQMMALDMISSTYEMSGALGQASREADGYQNVVGNLKESWKQFKAVIGAPMLLAVIPILKAASTGISELGTNIGGFITVMSNSETRSAAFKEALRSTFSPEFSASVEAWIPHLQSMMNLLGQNTVDMFSSKIGGITTLFNNLKAVLQPFVEATLSIMMLQFDTMALMWNDVFLPVLSFLIDAFLLLSNTILTSITPAVQSIAEKFQELQRLVSDAIQTYIIPMLQAFIAMIQELWIENQDKITLIGELFAAAFNAIASQVALFVGIFKSYVLPFLIWLVSIIMSNMDGIKAVFQAAFDFIGEVIKFFIALFKGDWQGMWDAVKTILQAALNFIASVFALIGSVFSSVGASLWSIIKSVFGNIKDTITDKLNGAKQSVLSIFGNIKDSIAEKINGAKQVVSDAIDKIKGFFNFSWSLPKLKLPHLSISGSLSIAPPSVPKFGIDWYKDGGVMTKPTAFGINPATGNTMVGGEAGAEAIAPIDVLQNYVRQAVAEQNANLEYYLQKLIDILAEYFPQILDNMGMQMVLDDGTIVGRWAPAIDMELSKIRKQKERGI